MVFDITIAGQNIEIESTYKAVFGLCKQYISDAAPASLKIKSTKEEILFKKTEVIEEAKKNHTDNAYINQAYLETLVVYSKIAEALLDYSTFLMHGSVIGLGDQALMITGPSGKGKSTRTKLIIDHVPGSYVINGDKPLLKVCDDTVFACGTPWCGKEGWNTNAMVPLKAIFILERSDKNQITELSSQMAFIKLLQQTYSPTAANQMAKTLKLLKALEAKVKIYKLESNCDPEVAQLLCKTAFS